MNKLQSLDLKNSKKVPNEQIKALGNWIGDALWLLEVELIKKLEVILMYRKLII